MLTYHILSYCTNLYNQVLEKFIWQIGCQIKLPSDNTSWKLKKKYNSTLHFVFVFGMFTQP